MGVLSDMEFKQYASILNSIAEQATGAAQITPTNTDEFVSVAQTALKTGYDPLLSAVSQVLTKTIFSVRPYSAKFKGLMADSQRYGNHVRKLTAIDAEWEEDNRYKLTDGYSIDQQKVKKPKVLQTNFYGEVAVSDHITIFKDQMDAAFSGPEEFARFIQMIMGNISDRIEQKHEETARLTIANLVAGKSVCDSDNVVYLLDKYEDETGVTGLDADTVKQPENFVPFAKWLAGYLKTLGSLLAERSVLYHKNLTISGNAVNIPRHTPAANLKMYLYGRELNQIESSVLSGVFNDKYLQLADHEVVNYWQSIDTPQGISVTPSYIEDDGTIETSPSSVTLSNVFGVIFDEEAAGMTMINQWSATAPFNADGGYTNYFWHFTDRYWNDFTENCVVLILDHSDAAVESISVTVSEGTQEGDIALTVDPTAEVGQEYYYQLGEKAVTVRYGQNVALWDAWNGTDDITPTEGDDYITVVIAEDGKAVASGYAATATE